MKLQTPAAIQRLMDEVRSQQGTPIGCFDRAHNRHNRSMSDAGVVPDGVEFATPKTANGSDGAQEPAAGGIK